MIIRDIWKKFINHIGSFGIKKKRLIRWLDMVPNTKYLIPQILIIDSEQDNWKKDEQGVGCVDFLSRELLDSFLDEEKQPEDILNKCRKMDADYIYIDTPEIKTQKDIEDLEWASRYSRCLYC